MRTILVALVIVWICGPLRADAERSLEAEQRATVFLEELSRVGDPSVAFDFVHWPTAFNSMRPSERLQQGIRTPADLERFVRQVAPQTLDGEARETHARMQQDLRATVYTVTGSSVEQNQAKVSFTATLRGKEERRQIVLLRINGQWYLPSPQALPVARE